MGFAQLIEKVKQAEDALEAQERRVAADMHQLKATWRQGWTPGRIVLAGVVSGFVIGRVEPLRAAAKGSSIMQMITALSGMVASASAQAAASGAEQAAETAEDVAETVAPGSVDDVALVATATPAASVAQAAHVEAMRVE